VLSKLKYKEKIQIAKLEVEEAGMVFK